MDCIRKDCQTVCQETAYDFQNGKAEVQEKYRFDIVDVIVLMCHYLSQIRGVENGWIIIVKKSVRNHVH